MVVCTISLVQATQNCQPESGSLNSQIIPRTKNGVSCSVCKLVIATVDAILTDAENELAIADALDNVCEVMPNFFVEECHFMVCTYYDQLINAVIEYFGDPLQACTTLTLCP